MNLPYKERLNEPGLTTTKEKGVRVKWFWQFRLLSVPPLNIWKSAERTNGTSSLMPEWYILRKPCKLQKVVENTKIYIFVFIHACPSHFSKIVSGTELKGNAFMNNHEGYLILKGWRGHPHESLTPMTSHLLIHSLYYDILVDNMTHLFKICFNWLDFILGLVRSTSTCLFVYGITTLSWISTI